MRAKFQLYLILLMCIVVYLDVGQVPVISDIIDVIVYLDAGQVPVISDIIDVYCCVFRCGPGSSDI